VKLKIISITSQTPGKFETLIERDGVRQQLDFVRQGPLMWELTKQYSDLSIESHSLARALLAAVQRVEGGAELRLPLELNSLEEPT
jgi:hypothetical protein